MNINKSIIFFLFCVIFAIDANVIDFSGLKNHLHKNGYKSFEGNIGAGNTTQPASILKILTNHSDIKLVGEIGFNAGHSSFLFLEHNKNIKVISFDISTHNYVNCAKEYIDSIAPDRHQLIRGSSLKTVPEFARKNPEVKFDLVFIDGGHFQDVPFYDICNMRMLSRKGTIVVIDDFDYEFVNKAYQKCVKNNLITRGQVFRSKYKSWVVCKYK